MGQGCVETMTHAHQRVRLATDPSMGIVLIWPE